MFCFTKVWILAQSQTGGKKALKTHRASTLTAHLIQRGLIVIRPGDTAPNRHVELFKLLHFITIVSFLQDKAGIKIQYFLLFLIFLFYLNLHTICSQVTDAKCMERQIYWQEWTMSEDVEKTHKHWIWLFSSVFLPHIWAQTRQCPSGKDRWWTELSCCPVHSHSTPPSPEKSVCKHSRSIHTLTFDFCPILWAALGFSLSPRDCSGISGSVYFFVLYKPGAAKPRHTLTSMEG